MLPRVLLLSAVAIWGWTFVATKILVAELGPVEILALRLAIGLPFLGLLLLVKRVPLRFGRADARPLLLGGAILTLHFLVQIAGIVTTTATNTGWIISASPLALAVFSYLFLRERIGWTGVAGIAVATTGILLLVSGGRLADLGWLRSTGDWLVLASAHTWALYTVATRDLARRRDPLAVTFGILLIAAVLTRVCLSPGPTWRACARFRRGASPHSSIWRSPVSDWGSGSGSRAWRRWARHAPASTCIWNRSPP